MKLRVRLTIRQLMLAVALAASFIVGEKWLLDLAFHGLIDPQMRRMGYEIWGGLHLLALLIACFLWMILNVVPQVVASLKCRRAGKSLPPSAPER